MVRIKAGLAALATKALYESFRFDMMTRVAGTVMEDYDIYDRTGYPRNIPIPGMDAAKQVVENRVNGLGVSEPQVQRQGDNRIIVEIPGIDNPDQAVATLKGTGLLEFVEMGQNPLLPGTLIQTDHAGGAAPVEICAGGNP